MTHSTTEDNIATADAVDAPLTVTRTGDPNRGATLLRGFRGMRAEDMMGRLADVIDYKFLETVLGCRGRKVPKDIGI